MPLLKAIEGAPSEIDRVACLNTQRPTDERLPHEVRVIKHQQAAGSANYRVPDTRSAMLAIAGTGYGLIGLLVIILLVVLIFYFVRRA
jgi:hypothetical protein